MRARTLGETHRMTIKLPTRNVARLRKLARVTGASSETEVIREALYTYEKVVEWLDQGALFYAVDPSGGEPWPVDFGIDVGSPIPHPKLKVVRECAETERRAA
jgi:ribbon-helix-helix CopG family protein